MTTVHFLAPDYAAGDSTALEYIHNSRTSFGLFSEIFKGREAAYTAAPVNFDPNSTLLGFNVEQTQRHWHFHRTRSLLWIFSSFSASGISADFDDCSFLGARLRCWRLHATGIYSSQKDLLWTFFSEVFEDLETLYTAAPVNVRFSFLSS